MLLNPFAPLAFIKISSLKATTNLLLILLIKSNLLRLKGGLIGGLFALILVSGLLASTSIAVGSLIYAYRLKKQKLIRLKKKSNIDVKGNKYLIRIYENLLDGSEHFALIKGKIKKGIVPRVRVISSNVVQNYLLNQNLPNSFNKTLNHFKKYNNCVLIFIRDTNLKSVTQTLRDYKSKGFYKKGKDKLIKNYGIGAQIIKSLQIKNMILVTRSRKKVVSLDGYGIKITKQEIIK